MAHLSRIATTQPYQSRLNTELTTKIENRIQSELSPYLKNSIIKIDLKKLSNVWHADVVIDSSRGFKASRRKDTNMDDLIENIISDLRIQFELTDTHRRHEIFLFDHQREYDHFTETLSASPFETQTHLKVLVIEDDPVALLILEKSMRSMGCQVDLISDPELALEKVKLQNYDLVILDWCLPYMDGRAFLKKADRALGEKDRSRAKKQSIPLVICSSKNFDEINLPLVSNFLFCQYWNKTLPFSTVISSIEKAIKSAGQHKTKAV